jgi:hypothetical protein
VEHWNEADSTLAAVEEHHTELAYVAAAAGDKSTHECYAAESAPAACLPVYPVMLMPVEAATVLPLEPPPCLPVLYYVATADPSGGAPCYYPVVAAAAPIFAAPMQQQGVVYMAGEEDMLMSDYYAAQAYAEQQPNGPTAEEAVYDSHTEVAEACAEEEGEGSSSCAPGSLIAELLSKPFEEWSQEDYEQYYLYEEQQFAQH